MNSRIRPASGLDQALDFLLDCLGHRGALILTICLAGEIAAVPTMIATGLFCQPG